MNRTESISWAADYLSNEQIEDPQLEAEILLAHSLNISRLEIISDPKRNLSQKELNKYQELIRRRSKHEPTAYITGFQPFYSLNFLVDRSVLVPRPETELLVDIVLSLFNNRSMVYGQLSIVDVGTGSGAIAVSLAKNLPNAKVIGIDNSPEALQVSQKNAELCQVCGRCLFVQGDLLEPLQEPVDIIVSNPPYIPSAEIENLQPEVRDWEPRGALDGGADGLDYIRVLINQSHKYLSSKGRLLFEFGWGQADQIRQLIKQNGSYKEANIIKDYSGIERIACLTPLFI